MVMKNRFFFLLISALLVTSCAEELIPQGNGLGRNTANFVPMRFNAVIEQVDAGTKAVLDGGPSSDFRNVVWQTGDEIIVFNDGYSNYSKFINVSENGTEAVFEGMFDSNNYQDFSLYPYSFADTTDLYRLILPRIQKYYADGVAPATLPMVADYTRSNDDDRTLYFRNLCGVLAFPLLGDMEVKSVTFTGYENGTRARTVAGTFSYERYNTKKATFNGNLRPTDGEAYGQVTLDCLDADGNGVQLSESEPTYFHIVLPPASYQGFVLDIHTNRGHAIAKNDKTLEITRANRTTVSGNVNYTITPEDLSLEETANSYLLSETGTYKFKVTKGNSKESVGAADYADVLWESSGYGAVPSEGSIITDVEFRDGYIYFVALKEGNAVIAAKDASGNILWSWHIWICTGYNPIASQQKYPNNAGYYMDRNLGALSATPGDTGASGMYYQWGRKDPFTLAGTSVTWPSVVNSDASKGTIDYAVSHPSTFIGGGIDNRDWLYTGDSSTDNTRWGDKKTIYDPCPAGWKVPSGGPTGSWYQALGNVSSIADPSLWNDSDGGMNLGSKFGFEVSWYPASGCLDFENASPYKAGNNGYWWTSTGASNGQAYNFGIDNAGNAVSDASNLRAYAMNVRCCRDGYVTVPTDGAVDLSANGTANSYIAPSTGQKYMFNAKVKGNSAEALGVAFGAKVLWESFGSATTPQEGDVISDVGYSADGNIVFTARGDGNAVIALMDDQTNILWSWHIWVCNGYDPAATQQQYYKSAIMMDRDLGATSATPGDNGARGLLYQWGRKDPMLGAGALNSNERAASTANWPAPVSSDRETGTFDYSIGHPMTFISSCNSDWMFDDSAESRAARWFDVKTKYDPCPPGWMVPKGGSDGVFALAIGSDKHYPFELNWDWEKNGIDFGGILGDASTIWFPQSSWIRDETGALEFYSGGTYLYSGYSGSLDNDINNVLVADTIQLGEAGRGHARSVRCCREGSVPAPLQYESLNKNGTANSYIVPQLGKKYEFDATVYGNGTSYLDWKDHLKYNGGYAEVVWESFGDSTTPGAGDVISDVSYSNGHIRFTANHNGNAVIALKDYGSILWSWHIWVSEGYDPAATQQQYGNAAIMMDRNLGATTASAGAGGSQGLLYQWGRKDPFLASGQGSSIEWPAKESSDGYYGTIDYSRRSPATFITGNGTDGDWMYQDGTSTASVRWAKGKTIYDPCPPGWRVPEGGEQNNVWEKAGIGATSFDSANGGMNFLGTYWYPAAGARAYDTGEPSGSGTKGYYWTLTTTGQDAYYYRFDESSAIDTKAHTGKGAAHSVRCCREDFVPAPEHTETAVNLSANGTANCYIVPSKGMYKFNATVKGNGTESVGTPVKAETLWETFSTLEVPGRGEVITSAVALEDGYAVFSTGRNGNALIAVKDASDNILWSWHIWVCEGYDPVATQQIYYNNAGTMMDRNLGALGAWPEDLATEGLLYQWGRKDPFPNSCMIPNGNGNTQGEIKMTQKLTAPVISDSGTGTVEYAVSHPTSIISSGNSDHWLYSPDGNTPQDHLWDEAKTIYDPCPPGWKVPESGVDGVWNTAAGKPDSNNIDSRPYSARYDENHLKGLNLSGLLGDSPMIWYPLAGHIEPDFNGINEITIGHYNLNWSGYYWGWNINSQFTTYYEDYIYFRSRVRLHDAISVRCQKIE